MPFSVAVDDEVTPPTAADDVEEGLLVAADWLEANPAVEDDVLPAASGLADDDVSSDWLRGCPTDENDVLPAAPRLADDDVNVGPAVGKNDAPLAIVEVYCLLENEEGTAAELKLRHRELLLASGEKKEEEREDIVSATTVVVVTPSTELDEAPPAGLELDPATGAMLDPAIVVEDGERVVVAAAVLLDSADLTVDSIWL
jgi:hypothetical protein